MSKLICDCSLECKGDEEDDDLLLASATMLKSVGGSDGTPRMLAKVAGMTSGKTRRSNDVTCLVIESLQNHKFRNVFHDLYESIFMPWKG